jgi:hypothetical protein
MGLKGSGPYFQRSMSNTVLAGLVYQICELYIDDELGKLATLKVCCYMSVLTPLVD